MRLTPSTVAYRRAAMIACVALLGLVAGQVFADDLELGASSREAPVIHITPSMEYDFEQTEQPAQPLSYESLKASSLPLAMRHRVDALWSSASVKLSPKGSTASDFPYVAQVSYQLRRSPWADPERMMQARLLDGTSFQSLVTREFGVDQQFRLAAGIQHTESIFSSNELGMMEQTVIPVEVRSEIGEAVDLIAGVEFVDTKFQEIRSMGSVENVIKLGLGIQLGDDMYLQASVGERYSEFNDGRDHSGEEFDSKFVWQDSEDAQYALGYTRTIRPSLLADQFVESDTISLTGDYTLSGNWAAFWGLSQSWADFESGQKGDIVGGEVAFTFSANENVSFSGGYIYRSGSLREADEEEVEQIVRLSATIEY